MSDSSEDVRKILSSLFILLPLVPFRASAAELRAGEVKTLTSRTRLFADAALDAPTVAVADVGTEVRVLSVDEELGWYWIRAHNREGWVPADVLERQGEARELSRRMGFEESPDRIHFLNSLGRFFYFESDLYLGTTTIQRENGSLLHRYRAWTVLGAGYGGRVHQAASGGAIFAEGGARWLRDSMQEKDLNSFQLNTRARWLRSEGDDFALGGFVAVGLHLSGWPAADLPLKTSAHALRWAAGPSVAGRFGAGRWFWVLEPAVELGEYTGLALNLHVLWTR
jgi:hypothetical protein